MDNPPSPAPICHLHAAAPQIFPAVNPPRQRDPSFEEVIRRSAQELGLEPSEEFVHQVVALR